MVNLKALLLIWGVYSLDEGEILNSRRKVVDVFGVDDLT